MVNSTRGDAYGLAVQHREPKGYESDKLLSYFKSCIIPLEGVVASGFESQLCICRGKRVVKFKQVPIRTKSLNNDDVFILDPENKIYQFNGSDSNIQERAKALEVTQFLKEKYHEVGCDVAIISDGKLKAESESPEFWERFDYSASISKKVASEENIIPATTPAILYRYTKKLTR